MAFNGTNHTLVKDIPLVLRADWQVDPALVSGIFSGVAHESIVDGDSKPTLLVPSKRRKKAETFPKLTMHAQLVQEDLAGGVVSNVVVDAIEGFEVVFEITNKYDRTVAKTPIRYSTTLNQLGAAVDLSDTEVRDVIFKPNGQLNAKVNENLLDFTVTIPALSIGREPSQRITIYRRKVIVFVPGLLGSTIEIKTSEGPVQIYPNIYPTVSDKQESEIERFFGVLTSLSPAALTVKGGISVGQYIYDAVQHRKIDLLECDAAGKPLLETKAELFRLLGALPGVWINQYLSKAIVYDVQDMLAEQWKQRGAFTNRPDNFDPFTLVPYPYDWRLDLEDSAQQLFRDLQILQADLQKFEDTDDLLSISGHSTGGVINRRVCGISGIEAVVDHSFFMNVPFRGAPKALSVLLFGGDPPVTGKYAPMMPAPLIQAESMVHIAANLPIVYFLAPSNFYPNRVSTLGGKLFTALFPGVVTPLANRDLEKEFLIKASVLTHIFEEGRSVDPNTGGADRANLALNAGEWNSTWWDARGRLAYRVFWDENQLARFNEREIRATETLRFEDNKRPLKTTSWNSTIAANATRFHAVSEAKIGSSAVNLYVFWSQGSRTTGSVDLDLDGPPQNIGFSDLGIPVNAFFNKGEYPKNSIDKTFDFRFQWLIGTVRQFLKFSAMDVDGDGTVPRASLLGIGAPNAKIFRAIPGNPEHVPAPNAPFVWQRMLDVLTGRDITQHLVTEKAENRPFVIT